MEINIGIPEKQREEIAKGLSSVLADHYTLYLKTHNYHWNVKGPMFQTLHTMFETQYTELAAAVDEIAERIRALGVLAPASYQEFAKLTSIKDGNSKLEALDMIQDLLESQETLIRTARGVLPLTSEVHDEATADLLTQRIQHHEKTTWMLRSLLQ